MALGTAGISTLTGFPRIGGGLGTVGFLDMQSCLPGSVVILPRREFEGVSPVPPVALPADSLTALP